MLGNLKLPGKIIEQNYNLEYGKNSLSIQEKALKKFKSFVIVDDLLATGGTVNCVADLLKAHNKKQIYAGFGLGCVLQSTLTLYFSLNFSVNSIFDLNFMDKKADIVWCQSLMSHLDENDIKLCLNNVKNICKEETKIYFTYFQQDGQDRNINKPSHSKIDIRYDQKVMDSIVHEVGLKTIFNGTIGHPRGQWMYICRI